MTRLIFAFTLRCVVYSTGRSQSPPFQCGNDIFSDIVRKNYPSLQEGFDKTFEKAQFLPGIHAIVFDDIRQAPGMYFVEIQTNNGSFAKKLIVL